MPEPQITDQHLILRKRDKKVSEYDQEIPQS